MVDGQENPIGVIYHFKLNEFQKHLALTRHVYNSMIYVINKPVWAGLTAEQQRILREESAAAGKMMREAVRTQEAKEIAALRERGMKVTEPDLAAFAAKMGPARDRVAAFSGEENMKKFLSFVK